jgi:hypothetical protein
MIALGSLWHLLCGALPRVVARLPRQAWYGAAGVAALILAWHWHSGRVTHAYGDGAHAQAIADRQHFDAAAAAAAKRQNELIATLAARQATISKGTNDALLAGDVDLARRYADLRLRWAAHQADTGRTGKDGTVAISGTTAGTDDAACAARGWVALNTAAAAAQSADSAVAKDDAWIAWSKAQAAAWPQD